MAGGSSSPVAATLRLGRVAPIPGQAGWLMRNKLVDRLGERGSERRGLSARRDARRQYHVIRPAAATGLRRRSAGRCAPATSSSSSRTGMVLLDETAGSDASIDIVSSRICDRCGGADCAREFARDRRRPDRCSSWRFTPRGRSREVKASKASIGRAVDQPVRRSDFTFPRSGRSAVASACGRLFEGCGATEVRSFPALLFEV